MSGVTAILEDSEIPYVSKSGREFKGKALFSLAFVRNFIIPSVNKIIDSYDNEQRYLVLSSFAIQYKLETRKPGPRTDCWECFKSYIRGV